MPVNILSTSYIDKTSFPEAADFDIEIDVIPFTEVNYIRNDELETQIAELCSFNETAIFTSAQAVKAIAGSLDKCHPQWDIYCIGHATRHEVLKHFEGNAISGAADDAVALADMIVADGRKKVTFFCGNKRLNSLPQRLLESGVDVGEVVVYETKETPVAVQKKYDAILFFSPSGVRSFFGVNSMHDNAVIFAVGNTTAKEVKAFTEKGMHISDLPSKEQVVADAIQFFKKQGTIHK